MRILFTFLFLVTACSPEKPQAPESTTQLSDLNLNRNYNKEEISFACKEGCQHHYKIYLNANKLVRNAVSLNTQQLESIQQECERFCQLDVFYRLNQAGLEQATPNNLESVPSDEPAPVNLPKKPDEIKSLEDL